MNSDGTLTFDPAHLAKMSPNAGGLARVFAAERWFYVRANGDALEVVAWDNGPDEFSQERVRTVLVGKLGYSDRSFRAVIPPTFDWAGRSRTAGRWSAGAASSTRPTATAIAQ